MTAEQTRRRQMLFAGALALLLVAALILPPLININRYQRQIAASLSASLGRPVEVSAARLQLLPRPALQIGNFAVGAAAGFGAEPMLQCSSVTAALRLSSLWRGRLEIARISLDEPSLNLERSASGEWSFQSLLVQASRTPQAPTAAQTIAGQHRFPYIEASHARINFKHGDEKLPFSFLDADVSVWLERPDQWQLRFAAQPARTDIHLSLADTGLVRISGSVDRASSAASLPLNLHVEWRKAPLGQLTRMLMAQDLGWRGDTDLVAHITGTPEALVLDVNAAAADFHREYFQPVQPLDLAVHCTATLHHREELLENVNCLSPVGSGSLALTGRWQPGATEMRLKASQVPASAALVMLRHVGARLSRDMQLSGSINGVLVYDDRTPPAPSHSALRRVAHLAAPVSASSGSLKATTLVLRRGDLVQPLPDLSFTVMPPQPRGLQPLQAHTTPMLRSMDGSTFPSLVLEAAKLDLGGEQPMVADARLSTTGFLIHASGSGRLRKLVPLASALEEAPLPVDRLGEDGTADYSLTLQGSWTPPTPDPLAETATTAVASADALSPATSVTGSLTLRGASYQPEYMAEPLQVASATAVIAPGEVRWNAISASLGKQHFTADLRIPVPCAAGCVRHFDLSATEADLGTLAASLRGDDLGVMHQLLNRVRLPSTSAAAQWPSFEGTVHINRLSLGRVSVAHLVAELALADAKLQVKSLDGSTLEGSVHGTGVATLAGSPSYHAQLQLSEISAPLLSQVLDEEWGPGMLDITADLKMSGSTASELSSTANGHLHWQWNGGALPELTTSPLSHFDRWTGDGKVTDGSVTLLDSRVLADGAEMPITGTIGRDRSLRLLIDPAEASAAGSTETTASVREVISGTLAAPVAEMR